MVNVEELTPIELKAMAYDELRKKEVAERNFKILNTEIIKRETVDQKTVNVTPKDSKEEKVPKEVKKTKESEAAKSA